MNETNLKALQKTALTMRPRDDYAYKYLAFEIVLSSVALVLSSQENRGIWLAGQCLLLACIWRWFSLLHSCAHGAFFKSQKLNMWTGHLASFFSLVPYTTWKESHLQHHRWTGSPHKDPSLPRLESELTAGTKKFLDFCWKFYIPIFSFIFLFVKKTNLDSAKSKASFLEEVAPYLIHLILIVVLRGFYFHLFGLAFLFYLITSDIVVLSQHAMIPMNDSLNSNPIPAPMQDQYTRTLSYPQWITKGVLLYFDKHTLHHIVPFVPHYYLGNLQEWSDNEVPWQVWIKEVKDRPGHEVYFN